MDQALLAAAQVDEDLPEIGAGDGQARIVGHGAPEGVEGRVDVAQFLQRGAEIVPRLGEVGPNPEGLAERLEPRHGRPRPSRAIPRLLDASEKRGRSRGAARQLAAASSWRPSARYASARFEWNSAVSGRRATARPISSTARA